MKHKLISFIAILFSIFCISRTTLATAGTCTPAGSFVTETDLYDTNKIYKHINVSSYSITCQSEPAWHSNTTVKNAQTQLIAAINSIPPTEQVIVGKPPIEVKNDVDVYYPQCYKNDGGIPCNDPDTRLVIKVKRNIYNDTKYDVDIIDANKGELIVSENPTAFYYGFKNINNKLEVVQLIPASKPSTMKYLFTDYDNMETEFTCQFGTTSAPNAVDSITFPNFKHEVSIAEADTNLKVKCWFTLPDGKTLTNQTSFVLYRNTFEDGNYVPINVDSSVFNIVKLGDDTTEESSFSNNVEFSIPKTNIPNGKAMIFSVISPAAIVNPGGYSVRIYTSKVLMYSTVIKFNKIGITCPDGIHEKDANGDCFNGCPTATPIWDSNANPKKCIADCTQSASVTINTGYSIKTDDTTTCACPKAVFPVLDLNNHWCAPQCDGEGSVSNKNGTPTCECEDKYTLTEGKCIYDPPPECSADADCGAHHECNNSKCEEIENEACENDSTCAAGKSCIDGHCKYETLDDNCNDDSDCGSGLKCSNWHCKEPDCSIDAECATGQVCQSNVCTTTPVTNTCTGPGQMKNYSTGKCMCNTGWACTPDTYGNCACTQYDDPNGCGTGKVKDSSTGSCICDEANGYAQDSMTGACVQVIFGKDRVPPPGCAITGPLSSANGSVALLTSLVTLIAIRLRRKFFD